jgi:hypothetical protein
VKTLNLEMIQSLLFILDIPIIPVKSFQIDDVPEGEANL